MKCFYHLLQIISSTFDFSCQLFKEEIFNNKMQIFNWLAFDFFFVPKQICEFGRWQKIWLIILSVNYLNDLNWTYFLSDANQICILPYDFICAWTLLNSTRFWGHLNCRCYPSGHPFWIKFCCTADNWGCCCWDWRVLHSIVFLFFGSVDPENNLCVTTNKHIVFHSLINVNFFQVTILITIHNGFTFTFTENWAKKR